MVMRLMVPPIIQEGRFWSTCFITYPEVDVIHGFMGNSHEVKSRQTMFFLANIEP
jgi:hypothetical protein